MPAPTNHASPLPKRLKQARQRANLSQRKLGIAAGIDQFSASSRINHYEKGRHLPDFYMAERLGKVLRCPTPYLYAREDDLAELIFLLGSMTPKQRRRLLNQLRHESPWHGRKEASI